MSVKRYIGHNGSMRQYEHGSFVSYSDYSLALSRIKAAEYEANLAVKIIEEFIDLDDNEYTASETWVDFQNWFEVYQKRISTIRAMEGKK